MQSAKPEKSGGAKLRDWDADLIAGQGSVMFVGLQLAKSGEPDCTVAGLAVLALTIRKCGEDAE